MTEISKRLESHPCPSCRKPPLHVFVRAGNKHYVECPRCGTRTARHDAKADALGDWSAKRTQRIQPVAVEAAPPLRRIA